MVKKLKNISKKNSYWASVIIVGIVVGISIQFARAGFTPPPDVPNDAAVSAPILTSGGQIITGADSNENGLTIKEGLQVDQNVSIEGDIKSVKNINVVNGGQLCLSGHCASDWPAASASYTGLGYGTTMWVNGAFINGTSSTVTCPNGYIVTGLRDGGDNGGGGEVDEIDIECTQIQGPVSGGTGCVYNGNYYNPGQSETEATSNTCTDAKDTCASEGWPTASAGQCDYMAAWTYSANGTLPAVTKVCQSNGAMVAQPTGGTLPCNWAEIDCWSGSSCPD